MSWHKMSVPCERWAAMDREQAATDSACIIAIVLLYLGFTFEDDEVET